MSSSPDFSGIRVGFRKTTLIDYPGMVASVIFFPGCNLRCPWCHNGELVLGRAPGLVPLDDCLREIERRHRLVQGVVLTGGEPLLQDPVGDIIRRVHDIGLSVKLDTNGSLPGRLLSLLESREARPDYVALDLKTDRSRYSRLSPGGAADTMVRIRETIAHLVSFGVQFEVRSVVVPGFFDEDALAEAAAAVPAGVPWFFSPFAPGTCLEDVWNAVEPTSRAFVESLARGACALGKNAVVRA